MHESIDHGGDGHWIVSNWKKVLNAFVLHYGDRIERYR